MSQKRLYGRSARVPHKGDRSRKSAADYTNPRIDPGLRPVFHQIGVPEPGPFLPDSFQLEAIRKLKGYDVLVSAPTGAGKTWIATQTIRAYLAEGRRVWYASPLKALSNSIYQLFINDFGAEPCGILTGDRKENPDAPVIVGTTEILRNQLYDSMHQGTSLRTDLVILDEAHYLSDPDRGVVWEEVLIYLAPRVKLMLLSATIPNADEVGAWLMKIRGVPNKVVRAMGRPVPLEMLLLLPDGLIVPLGGKRGLHSKVKKLFGPGALPLRRGRPEQIDFGKVIQCLRTFNLLPAIFFLKSRADCDRALGTCHQIRKTGDNSKISELLKSFFDVYPHLEDHRQVPYLLRCRVASHHGGQLPYWKVLVENMMSKGYLEAIFSTSTVAAGVNFPARTVVILQSDRFNGREFVDLTATELHQMIGRAGRRGKDNIGFGMLLPGPYQNPKLIHELVKAKPEPILSQIHINFSMTLNLLLSHRPIEIKQLAERSFGAFQEDRSEIDLKKRWGRMKNDLLGILSKGKCDISDPFEVLELIDKRQELKKEIRKTKRSIQYGRSASKLMAHLTPGRLFLHKNGNVYAAFKVQMEEGRSFCLAHNIRKSAQAKKHGFRLRRIDLNQIQALLDYHVDIPDDYTPDKLDRLFGTISLEDVIQLDVGQMCESAGESQDLNAMTGPLEKNLLSMPCEACGHLTLCHGGTNKTSLRRRLLEFRALAEVMAGTGEMLWLSFKRHLRFLKETGFANETDHLTTDGLWASKLRLDQPLLIAELIRKNAFKDMSPETLAGAIAPFVWDRSQQVDTRVKGPFDLGLLEQVFSRVLESIEWIRKLRKKRGFNDPFILFWPSAALYLWAKGVPWEQLLLFISADEGDMASLVMRTADHLRQVVNLKETHPKLAQVAEEGIGLILREPVYVE